MTTFYIDHHLLQSINLIGLTISVLGSFYVTYEFFGRRRLKWFIRIITPSLISAVILAPAGVLEYIYFFGFIQLVFRGGVLYGLVGVILGIFNGIFVEWPPSTHKPHLFSLRGCLIGLVLTFLIWFAISLLFGFTPIKGLTAGGIPTFTGAIAGGFWRFINWEPSYINKLPQFFWKGSIIGILSAFSLGFTVSLALGRSLVLALIAASILTVSGGIAGGLWHVFKKQPASFPNQQPAPLQDKELVLTPSQLTTSPDRIPLFSPRGCLIGLISAFFFSFVLALVVGIRSMIGLWHVFKKQPASFPNQQPAPLQDKELVPTPSQLTTSPDRIPLFSPRGCLIGLISAFFFSFVLAFTIDTTFGSTLIGATRGALTAASIIGPAGAATGGISRFIFWRANSLADGYLGGIGAILTILGFFVQLVPPLTGLLDLPVR